MSVLARYRKPGGFKQLLQLIETSQPVKQAKLIEVVEKEDPDWADMIRRKKIDPQMVLAWKAETITIIMENMNNRHCVTVLRTLEQERVREVCGMFKDEKYREIKQMLDEESDEPSKAELVTAFNHMLETVRYCDEEKQIDLRYINPALDLSEAA